MLKITKVFDDPTPNCIINLRLIKCLVEIMHYSNLDGKEQEDLHKLLLLIGKKLVSVWSHYNNYISYEDKLINKAKKDPLKKELNLVEFEYAQDLFIEFDEFLVQIKSCLDYLIKIPSVIIGHKEWNLRTFGAKGKDVIKALNNNIPGKYISKSKFIIKLIEDNQLWLEATIEARDKINHFIDGGINFEYFTVYMIKDNAKEILRVPMWSKDQTVRDFMKIVWSKLFKFCEDFIGGFIAFKIKYGLAFYRGLSNIDSATSPWKVTTVEKMHEIMNKTNNTKWNKIG